MASFTTVFKKVYGEALAPYGFVKLKGRQPYFVKLIGNEILLVISYRNEHSSDSYYSKAFNILGGVATVYRRNLSLDKSPYDNREWLLDNFMIYRILHQYDAKVEDIERILEFSYEKDNEESMYTAVKYSFEVTKELLLSELLKITNLKSCVEFYSLFNENILEIYSDDNFGQQRDDDGINEGLLNLKVYSLDEYTEEEKKKHNRWIKHCNYVIDHAQSSNEKETYEKMKKEAIVEEGKIQSVIDFEMIYNNPVQYARVMEELERRKTENLKVLRTYGFDV